MALGIFPSGAQGRTNGARRRIGVRHSPEIRLREEKTNRVLNVTESCYPGLGTRDEQDIPPAGYGGQSPSNHFPQQPLHPIPDDSAANTSANRERKAALWQPVGVPDQDQPPIPPGLSSLPDLPDLDVTG